MPWMPRGGHAQGIDDQLSWNGNGKVRIDVMDNGVGITAENLTRIFQHGFTTKKEGHGFRAA